MLKKKKRNRDAYAAFWFLLPSMIGFVLFVVFPVVCSLLLSFTEWNFLSGFSGIKFIGLDNFKNLLSFKDEWFTSSLVNSLVYTAVMVPLNLVLGLVLAVLMDRYVYCSRLFKILVFIPYVSSVVASAVVWMVVFQPSYGPVNSFLMSIGIANPPKWFVDMNWAFPTIMLFQLWLGIGYTVIVFMSGLKAIPNDLYEAATIDGANGWQKFMKVTVPLISPTTFFLFTMGIINSFKVFDSIRIITNGGPGTATSVIAFYIYQEAFVNYRMGTANAAAWVMFVIIFAVTLIQMRGQKKWVVFD